MKQWIIKIFSLLLVILLSAGCKKETITQNCFKLKVVYLYQGANTACSSNILEVEKTTDSDIPVGSLVTFVTNSSGTPEISLGEFIYLRLTLKVKKVPGGDPLCPFNWTYLLQGDICK